MSTHPTDAEIAALRAEFGITSNGRGIKEFTQIADFASAVLAKWGSPVVAGEPLAPDFYTACGRHECGLVPLPAYSNATEQGVMNLVLEAARREGYKGAAAERLLELGWVIRPVYLTPQPTQAQAGAVPLTDEWIRSRCKESWIFDTAKQWVRMTEAAHGIKGGQHGRTI